MEHKQFMSDALSRSPQPNLSFQSDKFTKKINLLSIPDTIHEQSSAELSGDSLKMEANDNENVNEEKENININQQVECNEYLNNSNVIQIDNSFLKKCERKLLEISNNDEPTFEGQNEFAESKQRLAIPRKLLLNNDSISTPPSVLRKEISILRSELAATDEFHDIEMQLLKEEKAVTDVDLKNYLEVLEKNAELVELYTALKNEYEEYRREQEKMKHEFQSKAADCLESLCSQIEASDSSLNFSSTSFVSFNGGVKSSTLLEDVSEVEATVMHDATVLATDPLSITNEVTFKTPMHTPIRSTKKLLPQESNSTRKTPLIKEVQQKIDKRQSTTPFDSDYKIQLLNLETALYDKVKEVENLEQRLFKVEDMSGVLKSECERMKESLSKKTNELDELTQKLFTETILLKPDLKDSLADVSGAKLLVVFFETIMERCKNIQDELIKKHSREKAEWEAEKKELGTSESLEEQIKSLNKQLFSQTAKLADLEEAKVILEKKLTDAESTILTREVEMRMLQTNVRQAQEDFASAAEALSKLESQLTITESEKKEFENRCNELQESMRKLKDEVELKEKLSSELDNTKLALESVQKENENLKQIIQQSEGLVTELKTESTNKLSDAETKISLKDEEIQVLQTDIMKIKEDFKATTEALSKLESQLALAESEKETVENCFHKLEETVKTLKDELMSKENLLPELEASKTVIESVQKENAYLKQMIQQSEETIGRLQSESLQSKEELNAKLVNEIETLRNQASTRLNEELEVKEKLTSELDATKLILETFQKENENLKQLVQQSEEVLTQLKTESITKVTDAENKISVKEEEIQILQSDILKVREENETLKQMIQQSEELVAELKTESTAKVTDAENKISSKEQEIQDLQLNIVKIQQGFTATTEALSKLESQLSSAESEKQAVEIRCQELVETVANLKDELVSKEKRLSELEASTTVIESVQKENAYLKQMIQQSEETIGRLQSESLQSKEELNAKLVEEVETLRSEASSRLNEELEVKEKLTSELDAIKLELENVQKENENLKQMVQQSEETKTDSMNKVSDAESKISLKEEEIQILQLDVIKIREENETLKQVIQRSEELVAELKAESMNKLSDAEGKISSREEEIQILQTDINKIKEEVAATTEQLSELESLLSLAVSEKQTAESRCQELEERVMNLNDELLSKEKSATNLKDELVAMEKLFPELEASKTLMENIQQENENLKQRIRQSEETIARLLSESLQSKEEYNVKLLEETESLKSQASSRLNTLIEVFEECKTNLLSSEQLTQELALLGEVDATELTVDRLKKLILQKPELQTEAEETKIVSLFLETLAKTCKEVKNEFMKNMETQRNVDLSRIDALQSDIKILEEKTHQQETRIAEISSEKEHLQKLHDSIANEMSEARNLISNCSEEIRILKAEEATLKQTKEELAAAEETILNLKSKLDSAESCRVDMETRCKELEETIEGLRRALDSSESLHNVRRCEQEDLLEKLKCELTSLDEMDSSDLPTDRLAKLITQKPELQTETGRTKVVSLFIETLTKTCKGVENELIKRIERKTVEWETQRNFDLSRIDTLQSEIKVLEEKTQKQETRIAEINSEKEDLQKLHDNVSNEMMEARNLISNCNEEIRVLKAEEATLKQTKEELAVAEETILALRSQLLSTESQKVEIEVRCQELEEGAVRLKAEIDTKETIIQGLDEMNLMRERVECENSELKRRILESEDAILELKKGLERAKEEHDSKEMRIKSLVDEIDLLRKEKDSFMEFSGKLEKLEKSNKDLMDIFSDVQSHLNLPEDTTMKLLSGSIENKKIFTEKMNNLVKTQTEGLKADNKNLKLSNENLKEKVKQLTKLLGESASADVKEELANLNASQVNSMTLRNRSKTVDLCVRRLDKLEDINHNLTELLTRVLTLTEFPDFEKLKLCSVRDFPNITKKVVAHMNGFLSKVKDLQEDNAQLDEECETYSNIIKELKKEAAAVWKANKEKTEALEADISRLQEEKTSWEIERQDLMAKISKLEAECHKLKSATKPEGTIHSCSCGNDFKKINELKRTILIKEQKLLELQDLEGQVTSLKAQIEYLKSALEREKKKVGEEKEKNKKLQNELNEATKNQKAENKKEDQNEVLDELRMRGTISGGVVQEFVDKEKIRKLSKDIGILKEMCRARYAEIKRLEAVNASLRNSLPKNSNQMDSPIRSRGYNTRSKNPIRDVWKSGISGKENSPARADVV